MVTLNDRQDDNYDDRQLSIEDYKCIRCIADYGECTIHETIYMLIKIGLVVACPLSKDLQDKILKLIEEYNIDDLKDKGGCIT
jgi:hypothetical protein